MSSTVTTDELGFVVDGLGAVGMRVARELAATDGPPVVLRSKHADRVRTAVEALGDRVRPWRPSDEDRPAVAIVTRPGDEHLDVVRGHLTGGRHAVSVADEPEVVRALLDLDDAARDAGRAVVVGAAFSPGLSCLLARHAAAALDRTSELRIAMVGAGGPRCVRRRAAAATHIAPAWRDGGWDTPDRGTELTWFPDPVGPEDVGPGELVEPLLLHRALPDVPTIVAGLAQPRAVNVVESAVARLPLVGRRPQPEPIGGIRVEAIGERDGQETMVVYAVVDRPAVAAGATAAVVASVAGGLEPGVRSVGEVGDPLPLLRDLARRGVKAATFEPTV